MATPIYAHTAASMQSSGGSRRHTRGDTSGAVPMYTPIMEFSAGVDEACFGQGIMPINRDAAVAIQHSFIWYPDTAASGDVKLLIAFAAKITGDTVDALIFGADTSVISSAVNSTEPITETVAVAFGDVTPGPGEPYSYRVTREGTHVSDTMAGELQLESIGGHEA